MAGQGVWKIGELAQQTGISIRTLHHYDQIGLLIPSQRTEAGHRLYSSNDLIRLHQIRSLRQLGLSLTQIQVCLEGPSCTLRQVIHTQLQHLRTQIRLHQQLVRQLEAIEGAMDQQESVSMDLILQSMEAMTMFEQYYTPEQLEQLSQRKQELGEDRIRQAEQQWQDLIGAVQVAQHQGLDPTSETVQELAAQWEQLVLAFTGGDPGITASLNRLYQQEGPERASRGQVPQEVFEFMGTALQIRRGDRSAES